MNGWILIAMFIAANQPTMTSVGPFATQAACQTASNAFLMGVDHLGHDNKGKPFGVCVAQAETAQPANIARQ